LSIICISRAWMRDLRPNPWNMPRSGPGSGSTLYYDVCRGSHKSSKEDYVQPIALRAAARKVHQRHSLRHKAPRIKKLSESEHKTTTQLIESMLGRVESNGTLLLYT